MNGQDIEELGPLRGTTGVGHVAGDQDRVEGIMRMERCQIVPAACRSRSLPRGPDLPLSIRKP